MTTLLTRPLAWGVTGVAATLLAPPIEPLLAPGPLAPAVGATAGVVVFATLARRRIPAAALAAARPRRIAARTAVLTLKSFQEEALWRALLLGGLVAPLGRAGALAISSALFAAAHAGRQGRRAAAHLLTGVTFGIVYLATGRLIPAVAAHATYNVLVGMGALAADDQVSFSATRQRERGFIRSSIAPSRALRPQEGALAVPAQPAVASLIAVRKEFGGLVALDGVDLHLRPGEVLGLLGPNGAGKTTAVSILLGIRRPDAGQAVLFGREPRDAAARRRIGVVLQDVGFPPTLRVGEIVDLVRAHFADPLPRHELLERFELGSIATRQAGGLSGGQRRRLAVALAFAGRPRALFLDEPTAAMDANGRRALWRGVSAFAASGGAVLLTTQQLDEAEELATRIVMLVRGRVLLEGSVDDVRARAGMATVRFRAERLPALPPHTLAESRLDRHLVYVQDPEAFVTALVRSGIAFHELEVSRVSLEDAFVALTGSQA
jgi:ABC-2 type transport system ATP-binding protein